MKKTFSAQFAKALDVVQMKVHSFSEVAKSEESTKWGIVFFALPVLVNLILAAVTFPSGFSAIFSRFLIWPLAIPVLALSGSVIGVAYVAKKYFNAKGEMIWLFRVASHVSIVLWLTMILFLLGVLGIFDSFGLYNLVWVVNLVLVLTAAEKTFVSLYGVSKKDALILTVGVLIGYFILKSLLGSILVGSSYRMLY